MPNLKLLSLAISLAITPTISQTFNTKAYVSTQQILLHVVKGFRLIKEHILSAFPALES